MPSSTLLPTPEPANRPMRWPRPTVSIALMARTPTSSTESMGARDSGLTGGELSGTLRATSSGPSPSSGRPAASTTRPSMPSPTGRRLVWALPVDPFSSGSGAPGRAYTRAPGSRPATSVCDIKKSRSPAKPTTSASACRCGWPGGSSIRQSLPTGSCRPTASSTSPTARVRRPEAMVVSQRAMLARAFSSVPSTA